MFWNNCSIFFQTNDFQNGLDAPPGMYCILRVKANHAFDLSADFMWSVVNKSTFIHHPRGFFPLSSHLLWVAFVWEGRDQTQDFLHVGQALCHRTIYSHALNKTKQITIFSEHNLYFRFQKFYVESSNFSYKNLKITFFLKSTKLNIGFLNFILKSSLSTLRGLLF